MSAPDYARVVYDVSVAQDRKKIVDTGTKINHIAIEVVPAGTVAFFHLGNREGIPIVQGESWDVWAEDGDGCPVPHNEGLFITNDAGGGSMQLVVSFGGVGVGR